MIANTQRRKPKARRRALTPLTLLRVTLHVTLLRLTYHARA